MNYILRTFNTTAVCLGLALAAGCVVGPHGRVVFIPPPFPVPPPPPRVIVAPPVVPPPQPVVVYVVPSPLVRKAERGDPVAQFTLGSCYANGRGVSRNYAEAVHWYYLSARQGYAPAQYRLAACYYRGIGTPQNFAVAAVWYRKAAVQGDAAAQDGLGMCYLTGRGVPRNPAEAARWFQFSAAQGYQAAAIHLRQTPGYTVAVAVGQPPPHSPPPSMPAPSRPPPAPNALVFEPAESAGGQMTVDEIKELSSAGVKADTLTDQIKSTNSKFTSQDIAMAQSANFDPSVIACMKENLR